MAKCFICGRTIRRKDIVPGGDEGKTMAAPAHIDCVMQDVLDRRGKGDKLSDVLAANPHIARQFERVRRMGEARLRGDEAEVKRIAAEGR